MAHIKGRREEAGGWGGRASQEVRHEVSKEGPLVMFGSQEDSDGMNKTSQTGSCPPPH